MREFAFAHADTTDDALTLGSAAGTRYLAGGTNLVDLMKLGVEQPTLLVDVTSALDTSVEETPDGGLRIGAGARNSELAADPVVRRRYPVLAEALLAGASGQLRNLATTGGNLLQRTRCPYFQDVTKPCNKRRPGSGCPARTGEHRNLAIIGGSERCIATHPSDLAVALASLDAIVHVETTDGQQTIPLAGFYRRPGDSPDRDTTLPDGALVTAVQLPPAPSRSRYRKVRERASYAFAIASVAVAVDLEDGVVDDIRIAFGAIAPMPWRAAVAEGALRGRPLTESGIRGAMEAEFAAAEPLRDNAYKIALCTSIAVRTLLDLGAAA